LTGAETNLRKRAMLRTAMGPAIEAALGDPRIIEIMVNPDGVLRIDLLGKGRVDTKVRIAPDQVERIIRLVASHVRGEVNGDRPIVSAELPAHGEGAGERFEGILPPVATAPCFAIRKPAARIHSLGDYVADAIMSREVAEILRQAVLHRANILVVGGTSSGKTTLANALLNEMAEIDERVVIIEDTRELQCPAADTVALRTRTGHVTIGERPQRRGANASRASTPDPAPPRVTKVDPETLAIRGRIPRAIRFRKDVIIAGTAAAALAVGGITWFALGGTFRRSGKEAADLSQPNRKPSETIAALPTSYGNVPKLGPPLPGDLGRPILRAQERGNLSPALQSGAAAPNADVDRERREGEIRTAFQSALMVQSGKAPVGITAPVANDTKAALLGVSDSESVEGSEQDRKAQFAERLDTRGNINPHVLSPPSSANMLMAGSVIAGSLITGINSDVSGMVIAQVTQQVFDSATGEVLLIPQGARLLGKYDSALAYGQSRALVVWQRLVMPDGQSLRLDNMPAAEPSGQAGLADKVNYHSGQLLKGVAIATLLGVGTELSISGESDLVQAIREAAQTNASRAGDQITQRNLDIRPTISVRPGAPIRLMVRQDLMLKPWKEQERRP
jgi:type IV secretion system protein VirB10